MQTESRRQFDAKTERTGCGFFRRNRLHLNHPDFWIQRCRDHHSRDHNPRCRFRMHPKARHCSYFRKSRIGRIHTAAVRSIRHFGSRRNRKMRSFFCPTRRMVLSQPKDLRLLHLRLQLFAKPVSMFCLVLSFVGTSVIVDCISECGKCITDFCRHLGLSHPEQFGCILNRQFTAIPQKKDLTL